jgi:hypothetical protein
MFQEIFAFVALVCCKVVFLIKKFSLKKENIKVAVVMTGGCH